MVFRDQNQLLPLELILGGVKIYYFLSESLLEELPNINHCISKSVLTKLILTELILPKINSTNAKTKHTLDSQNLLPEIKCRNDVA